MKLQLVRWAAVLGIVAAVWTGQTFAQNPPLEVSDGWEIVDWLETGAPLSTSGYTTICDTEVMYKALWNTAESPVAVPIHVKLSDGTVDYWASVPGQTQGTDYLGFRTGLASSLTLTIDAHHPLTYELVRSDDHTLPIVAVNTGFPDFLSDVPIPASTVENWMTDLGNSAVSSACGWLFDSETISDYAVIYSLPESIVVDRFNSLESQLKQLLGPAWRGWVGAAYGQQSQYVIKVGSGHPLLGDVEGALSSYPQGINVGTPSLEVSLNTGAIADTVLDAIPAILQNGQLPTIPSDRVWINQAGIRFTGSLVAGQTTLDASLRVGARQISFDHIDGLYIDGTGSFVRRWGNGWFVRMDASAEKEEGQDSSQGIYLRAGFE